MSKHQEFLDWFRESAPYIRAHQGRTVVVSLAGDTLASPIFPSLLQDIALISRLGIKLAIVFDTTPQFEKALKREGIVLKHHNGQRVVDAKALDILREVTQTARLDIESILSMGLSNTPEERTKHRVVSGNFVVAKPLGIADGVDFEHAGTVRNIDAEHINQLLALESIVLVSSLSFSPTGELFYIPADEVATCLAIKLPADKLMAIGKQLVLKDTDGKAIRELSLAEADKKANQAKTKLAYLKTMMIACHKGVSRLHLLPNQEGVLLAELFTRDGIGTMIAHDGYETLRAANQEDIGGLIELMAPLQKSGVLAPRSAQMVEREIERFTIIERDGTVIGSAALHPFIDEGLGELACFAVHPDYQNQSRGAKLLKRIEEQAKSLGIERLVLLTTHTAHWFQEHGFKASSLDALPLKRRLLYNYQRKSKVFVKVLK